MSGKFQPINRDTPSLQPPSLQDWLPEKIGLRRFHLRGFDAAQGEWNLVCIAWNLRRMYALGG